VRIVIAEGEDDALASYRQWLAASPDRRISFHASPADAEAALLTARRTGDPAAVIFADGVDVAHRLRAAEPEAYLVLVAPPADLSAERLAGLRDRLFLMARPFEPAEMVQAAMALGARWQAEQVLAADRAALRARVLLLEERALELAAAESRAQHLATHDALTEAPNRLAFSRALAERARGPGCFATAMLDLDRFKQVNDTLGHLAGDALIRQFCARLIRAAPPGAMVARLGGDEFGVLFDCPDGEGDALAACERLVDACSGTADVFGHSVRAGASAGLVVADGGGGTDPDELLRRADLALNGAKGAGRGRACLFDAAMDEGQRLRRRIEEGLRSALAGEDGAGGLHLAFQPIVERDGLRVAGFEALLRWHSPEWGAIEPATFLAVAEECDLIHDLCRWTVTRALAAAAEWTGHYVSINFSPRQFRSHDLPERLAAAAQAAGVRPGQVQVEVTEAAIFADARRAADTLTRLRAAGFRAALDDFGTGRSSLYDIRTFALDCLKIDRPFIDGMGRERESAAVVHSIVHLGRALGLGVVAEGVETAAQAQALRLAGASHLQGNYLSPPVDADTARALAAAGVLTRVAALPAAAQEPAAGGRRGH